MSACTFVLNFSENNTISVWNDGRGIPVEMHKDHKVYVPTLIFGHLLTSSNYNDEEKKVTGGRNGYGAKLCNIFSTKFVVETCSSESGKKFKQVRLLTSFTGVYLNHVYCINRAACTCTVTLGKLTCKC